jgi:hypothetical protein
MKFMLGGAFIVKKIKPETRWQMNLRPIPIVAPASGYFLKKVAIPSEPNAKG